MAPETSALDPAENVDFLISLIMTAEEFRPNFRAAASQYGMQNLANAQRKFKAIVEKSGKYDFKANKITNKPADANFGSSSTTVATPATTGPTPAGKAAKKRAAPAAKPRDAKRRKKQNDLDADRDADDDDDDDDDGDDDAIDQKYIDSNIDELSEAEDDMQA